MNSKIFFFFFFFFSLFLGLGFFFSPQFLTDQEEIWSSVWVSSDSTSGYASEWELYKRPNAQESKNLCTQSQRELSISLKKIWCAVCNFCLHEHIVFYLAQFIFRADKLLFMISLGKHWNWLLQRFFMHHFKFGMILFLNALFEKLDLCSSQWAHLLAKFSVNFDESRLAVLTCLLHFAS